MQADWVVVLDDDDDLRVSLADVLEGLFGLVALPLGSYDALLARSADVLSSRLAILDINLGVGVPSGIDAYHWLRDHGYTGRIAFLTGHARSHPLVAQAEHIGTASVLEKPVDVDALEALVRASG